MHVDTTRANQYHDVCDEIEQDANDRESRELFNKIKYLSKEFQTRTQIIQDELGNTIMDPTEMSRSGRNTAQNYLEKTIALTERMWTLEI